MSAPGSTNDAPLLGIDWGSSNRRAYLLDAHGALLQRHDDHAGILHVEGDFEQSLAALLKTLGLPSADIIMSGMVGSRNGWREAPYLSIDQPIASLHDALMEIHTALPGVRCRIVPGYRYVDVQGLPDVIRGEETQLLGALRLSAASGWFLLPGTHSKWARIQDGCIREFLTFMTGELFALLSEHGTLSKAMAGQDDVPEAFAAGLQAAQKGGFTHMAFCCRALVVTDMMPARHTASYLSGLLIGAELREILHRSDGIGGTVQIVGSTSLASRYHQALEIFGLMSRAWQPDEVYLAALQALFQIEG